MELIKKKVSELIPYINNSRTHSEEQITQLISSIKEFGFTNPILLAPDNSIIAGHGRLQAVKRLGHEEVPCIVVEGLTKTQIKALIIADNQLALNAGWDLEKLSVEIEGLKDEDFNIDILGFEDDFIKDLKKQEFKGLTDENEIPDVKEKAKNKLGDLWLLGNHRLMCGDSTNNDNVNNLLHDKRLNIVFTSPPYNAGKSELLSGNTHLTDNKYQTYDDNKNQDQFFNFLLNFTKVWIDKADCLIINIQQLAGNKIAFIEFLNHFKNNLIDVAIWNKGHSAPAMAENVMNSCFEYIIFLTNKEKPSRAIPNANFRGTVKNVYDGKPNRNNEFSKFHGATFPVDFPYWVINNFTKSNTLIGDCFGGTGTTLIASEKLNRTCFLMELDKLYCDIIIQRWQQFTGKEAIHEQSGKTYNSI